MQGGKLNHRSIAHYLSQIFAKDYKPWLMYVEFTANQMCDIF